jgi:NAD(P)H-hydrate repair Nnr-like enzyme with NAD(P)H-hydrate dehydratase domain
VFDADALRIIAGSAASAHPRLLTPHAGEAAALLGVPAPDADRFATARALRALAPSIYKGACSVVTGDVLQVLSGGLPQLGTAGSGDVLAGIAGALLAWAGAAGAVDTGAVERLALDAAWLHQEAGRRAGGPGVRASEIADAVPAVREELARSAVDRVRA